MATTELTLAENAVALRQGGIFDEIGLNSDVELSYEEWESLGFYFSRLRQAMQWAIGDWLNYGETVFGDKFEQAVHETGYTLTTVQEYARVAANVARPRRLGDLTWSHHQVVAALTAAQQRKLLARARRDDLSVEALRDLKREEEAAADGHPNDVADPPVVTLSDAARRVWIASSRHGETYHCPEEPMLALGRALGEPV